MLRPLAVTYYLSAQCNLDCSYCEDFGLRRNSMWSSDDQPLPLPEALQVLRAIRSGVDNLILTGGEPLLYPEIASLILQAKHDLKFATITLLTNGLVLGQHQDILSAVDRLVVSLDSINPAQWASIINMPVAAAQTIVENVQYFAGRQAEFGYRMIINCVLTPETLSGAKQLLDFCSRHNLLVSFSPQAVNNWPRYDLLVSAEYRQFLADLPRLKRRGARILGSMAYLRSLLSMSPYSCYPTLVPRVMPNGDLIYPCRPIEKENDGRGGRSSNLLRVANINQSLKTAQRIHNQPPRLCGSCFQQCFAEPSLMQAKPLSLLSEWLRYPASRRTGLATYAPG